MLAAQIFLDAGYDDTEADGADQSPWAASRTGMGSSSVPADQNGVFDRADTKRLGIVGAIVNVGKIEQKTKGFAQDMSIILPRGFGDGICCTDFVARAKPGSHGRVLQMCTYASRPSSKDPTKNEYYALPVDPVADKGYKEFHVGEQLKFGHWMNSAPTVNRTTYPFQNFTLARIGSIELTHVQSKKKPGESFNSLSGKPSTVLRPMPQGANCHQLITELRQLYPPGYFEFANLTHVPPNSDEEVALDDKGASAAATPLDQASAGPSYQPGYSQPGAAPAVDVPIVSPAPVAAPAVVVPPAAPDAAGGSSSAAPPQPHPGAPGVAAPAAAKSKVPYKWMGTLPTKERIAHSTVLLSMSRTPASEEPDPISGMVQLQVEFNQERWVFDKHTFNDVASGKEVVGEVPALDFLIRGFQWDYSDPNNRIVTQVRAVASLTNGRAGLVLGTYDVELWKKLAPVHLGLPGAFGIVSAHSELSASNLVQSDRPEGRRMRKKWGLSEWQSAEDAKQHNSLKPFRPWAVGDYRAYDVIYDLDMHLALYGIPITKACAMKILTAKFGPLDEEIAPINKVPPLKKEYAQTISETMSFYHPHLLNLMECTATINTNPSAENTSNYYLLLAPVVLNDAMIEAAKKHGLQDTKPETMAEFFSAALYAIIDPMASMDMRTAAYAMLLHSFAMSMHTSCLVYTMHKRTYNSLRAEGMAQRDIEEQADARRKQAQRDLIAAREMEKDDDDDEEQEEEQKGKEEAVSENGHAAEEPSAPPDYPAPAPPAVPEEPAGAPTSESEEEEEEEEEQSGGEQGPV